jgi:hypothetical protein
MYSVAYFGEGVVRLVPNPSVFREQILSGIYVVVISAITGHRLTVDRVSKF